MEKAVGKRKRSNNTQQEILMLAKSLFEKMDYDTIQIKTIADTMNVSKANIYYHYATKQTLFFDVYNLYYKQNIEDNLKILSKYGDMSVKEFKEYMLRIAENLFEHHFDMLRLIKIHSITIDKGVDKEKIKNSLEDSVSSYEIFINELLKHENFFNKKELLQIFSDRSALCIGYFYMFMEPKSIDEKFDEKEIEKRKKIYKRKVLAAYNKYLMGVLAEI